MKAAVGAFGHEMHLAGAISGAPLESLSGSSDRRAAVVRSLSDAIQMFAAGVGCSMRAHKAVAPADVTSSLDSSHQPEAR